MRRTTSDTDENAAPPAIYELEISLRGVKPRIWRRIHVSNELTLAQFHEVLQRVMGWEDMHMHEFEILGRRVQGSPAFMPREDSGEAEQELTSKYRLSHFKLEVKDEIGYEYGFGRRLGASDRAEKDSAARPGGGASLA
jgi:hypothetical protein